jgi:hypothetical protein
VLVLSQGVVYDQVLAPQLRTGELHPPASVPHPRAVPVRARTTRDEETILIDCGRLDGTSKIARLSESDKRTLAKEFFVYLRSCPR